MSLKIIYNLVLKKSEVVKLTLPNLKSSCLLLRNFEMKCDQKAIDIKLKGKDTLVSYGEAVFYQSSVFDLSDKLSQIIEADNISVEIKNLCTSKDAVTANLNLVFNYSKIDEGRIIYNNVYTLLNPEGLANILTDISKAGKHITKLVWTSPNKLTSLDLIPQFETQPVWLKPLKLMSDTQNQIVMDLNDDTTYDPDLVNQLIYYSLKVPENLEKLGIIVYGYTH